MAANELAAHASLQPPTVMREPQHVTLLLGGFSPASGRTAGEQVCLSLVPLRPMCEDSLADLDPILS